VELTLELVWGHNQLLRLRQIDHLLLIRHKAHRLKCKELRRNLRHHLHRLRLLDCRIGGFLYGSVLASVHADRFLFELGFNLIDSLEFIRVVNFLAHHLRVEIC